jgi:hypothetical protein
MRDERKSSTKRMMTMTKTYRTADDVADMEQELQELRLQLDHATRSLDFVTAERNRLQV